MERNREQVKALIELSANVEDADKVIVENFNFKSVQEKIAFLKGMFDVEVFEPGEDMTDEMTYFAMLEAIINAVFF